MADPVDPAEHLLEDAPVDPGSRLLIMEGGSGGLLDRFAPLCQDLVFHNSDFLKHAGALGRLEKMGLPAATCVLGDIPAAMESGNLPKWPDSPVFPPGHFDQVLYRLGKGTAALHGAIIEAWGLLREGGSLFLAGHTREGIKSLAKRAGDHFGHAELLTLKSSCRLLRFRKSGSQPGNPIPDPHYFDPVTLVLELPGVGPIPYLSKPGVFSYRATDAGTVLLARNLGDLEGMRTLDLGCGSGVLSLAAFRLGAKEALGVDSNAVAVAVAKRNFEEGGFPGRALCTNLTDGVEGEFDVILSNPPFHKGSETDYSFPARILDAALLHLKPGGRLMLVANEFLDYPGPAKNRFASCEMLVHANGFRVYRMLR